MKKAVPAGVVVAAFLWLASLPVAAVDGVAVQGGTTGSGRTDIGRVSVQWDWSKRWFQAEGRHLGGYWDVALGYWKSNVRPGQNDEITDIGVTPVFRFQSNDLTGFYLEAGVGFHWLSKSRIGDRRFSTQFQFSDHAGLGYRFGARGAYDLGYRFQHLSNANIKKPNDGIDFHQVRLQYHF
jgi:lipid A 3-O-deacylase